MVTGGTKYHNVLAQCPPGEVHHSAQEKNFQIAFVGVGVEETERLTESGGSANVGYVLIRFYVEV